jgi:hypothetical protein
MKLTTVLKALIAEHGWVKVLSAITKLACQPKHDQTIPLRLRQAQEAAKEWYSGKV